MTTTESWRSNTKREEWLCSRETCKTRNFMSRFTCRQCNYPRHGTELSLNAPRRRDWYCTKSECFEFNFASRKICRQCGTERCETSPDEQFVSRSEI